MSIFSRIEHSVEHGLSDFGHGVANEFSTIEHDIVNSARVGEVLAKGAWDYTVAHPGDVAKTLVIAAGVGLVSGALTPLLPAVAIVGVCATLGVVGTAAMGIQTFDSFKKAMPDLEIVWDADHHSKAEVAAAEKNVERDTGSAVTNLALLPATFLLGNYTGNLGTQAVLAASAGGEIAATSAVVTEAAVTAEAASGCATATATDAAVAADCPTSLPNVDFWTRVENNPVFGFFSSPYVEGSDIKTFATGLSRIASTGSGAARHES
jgi:hypothetical protein